MSRFKLPRAALLGLAVALAPAALFAADISPNTAEGRGDRAGENTDRPAMRASGGDRVLVIDAPDLRKVDEKTAGPRFTTLIGQEIYSNAGKKIGKIEDFVMANHGEIYAVIDTSNGPIEKLIRMGDDEMLILSLRELRKAAPPTSKPRQ